MLFKKIKKKSLILIKIFSLLKQKFKSELHPYYSRFPIVLDLLLWHFREKKDRFRVKVGSIASGIRPASQQNLNIIRYPAFFTASDSALADNQPLNKKKVVLFLIHWYELGGAESFALDTLRWAAELGMRTIIVATVPSQKQNINSFEKFADELYFVDEKKFIGGRPFQDFLFKTIAEGKVNVIHIHHSVLGYEALPQIKEKFPNVKVVDTLHIVEYAHGGFPHLSLAFHKHIDQTHVISQTLAEYLVQHGVPKKKIFLKYLVGCARGIKNSEEDIRQKYQTILQKRKVRIAFIGRLTFQKKPYAFVRLVKKLSKNRLFQHNLKSEFHIFGDGEYRNYIKKEEEKIDDLKFWGKDVTPQEFFKTSDIVVLPSRNEGIALVAFECSMAGVLFFTTRVGAQSEFVPNLFLVPDTPFSYRALKRKIMNFFKDPELYIDELIQWHEQAENLVKYSANKEWLLEFYK